MTLDELKQIVLRRGTNAKTILDDEAFKEALIAVKDRYMSAFEQSKIKESEVRETAYMAVRLLKEIEGQLRTYVSDALYEQNKP